MKTKSLYERLAVRFVGEGRDADRRMYITVLDPASAAQSADKEVLDDVRSGAVPGVKSLNDVAYFTDNGEFAVLVKPTRTVWTPSYRNLGAWDNITDNYDDESIDFILGGGVRDW